VEVVWESAAAAVYPVAIQVNAVDRPGLLSDVVSIIADTRTNIASASTVTDKNRLATIDLVLEIRNHEHLAYLTNKISRVRDVLSVTRTGEAGAQAAARR